jgi:signal transduction histidine kinase
VQIIPGPDIHLMVDPDQFEQMLINLARNAVEAALEPRHTENGSHEAANPSLRPNPEVVMHWDLNDKDLVVTIDDNGPGFLNPSNAFVPFYTTKPAGSGIGLVLARQIAEAHGGSIELLNLTDKKGCRARIVLPRAQPIA